MHGETVKLMMASAYLPPGLTVQTLYVLSAQFIYLLLYDSCNKEPLFTDTAFCDCSL